MGAASAEPLAVRKRSITTTTYEERLHRVPPSARLPRAQDLEWIPLADLPFAAVAGPHLRWIGELAALRR